MRVVSSSVLAGLLLAGPSPAAAQAERANGMYDQEIGAKGSFAFEPAGYGYQGIGVLIDGGFAVCRLRNARCLVIGEFAYQRFGRGRSGFAYVSEAGGLRFGGLVTPRTRVFVQFLAGVQHDLDVGDAYFGVMPGGGINVAVGERVDLQLQADVPFSLDGPQFRLSAGLSLPLGRR